ncbi:PREDICTED: histone-lysine N-methyltransferase EHMT2-like isoform X2 [Priapulus caudatus]|nr:PREDICTED: histone-lysine N-methyltransferase EHMT2-like isoform X2 [Priapulus caudatus]
MTTKGATQDLVNPDDGSRSSLSEDEVGLTSADERASRSSREGEVSRAMADMLRDVATDCESGGKSRPTSSFLYEDDEVSFVVPAGHEDEHDGSAAADGEACDRDVSEKAGLLASEGAARAHHLTALKENIQTELPLKRQKARKSFPSAGLRSKTESAQEVKMRMQQSVVERDGAENARAVALAQRAELENIVDLSLDLEHFRSVGLLGFASSFPMDRLFARLQLPAAAPAQPVKRKRIRFGVYSLQNQQRKRRLNKRLRSLSLQQQQGETLETETDASCSEAVDAVADAACEQGDITSLVSKEEKVAGVTHNSGDAAGRTSEEGEVAGLPEDRGEFEELVHINTEVVEASPKEEQELGCKQKEVTETVPFLKSPGTLKEEANQDDYIDTFQQETDKTKSPSLSTNERNEIPNISDKAEDEKSVDGSESSSPRGDHKRQSNGDGEESLSGASSTSESDSKKLRLEDLGLVPRNGLSKDVTDKLQTFLHVDNVLPPLCHCRVKVGSLAKTKATKCQALNTIDDKVIGCCKNVVNHQLVRPSPRISFFAVCEVHRTRLRRHQCCPMCGLYCTQGDFIKCCDELSHMFHKDCTLYNSDGVPLCPHCGSFSEGVAIKLKIRSSQLPSFLEQQRKSGPHAQMTFPTEKLSSEISSDSRYSVVFSESGKTFSAATLPLGPDRKELETILSTWEEDSMRQIKNKSLYSAARAGDVEKVLILLGLGMDPTTRYEEASNGTALHVAAEKGNVVITHLLIQAGACVNVIDDRLRTPLMDAADNNRVKVMKYLLMAGAFTDTRGEDSMTCLHLAAKAGNLEAVVYLIESGKLNVNLQDEGGWTALIWATEYKHLEVVRYLTSRGGNAALIDVEENTALHWSSFSGCAEIAEIYLSQGCDINGKNEHGDTPLHIASRQDHYDIVVLLLSRGASVHEKNNQGEEPISCCPDPASKVWMALRVNLELSKTTLQQAHPTEKVLHRDVSLGRENVPIVCLNWHDDEGIPEDYQYVTENVETSQLVSINRLISSLQHCQCRDNCGSTSCTCTINSVRLWYDAQGKLVEDFNMHDPPILFECNKACRCWRKCSNRIVQDGIKVRLQLFRTPGKGWGVRPLQNVSKGTFICEYIGEVITDSEADTREDDSYLFDLDNKEGETYCIDARYYGNVARFINHLCEPNVVPIKVFVDHQDLRFPRIALFASRDIRAYEELGFDYGDKFWIIKYKHFTCTCASDKCKYSTQTIDTTVARYYKLIADLDAEAHPAEPSVAT